MANQLVEVSGKQAIVKDLQGILADTYVLYLKTHAYHWNVTGPLFNQWHTLFEEQYQNMWAAVDTLAERLRVLGAKAPTCGKEMAQHQELREEEPGNVPEANQMVANLADDHARLASRMRPALHTAMEAKDDGTADILTERLRWHEKVGWIMRSSAE